MEIKINYHVHDHWHELNTADRNLVEQSISIAQQAYAPYSKFHVGAALLLKNGEIVLGNNQENIAYPSGMCAERTALFYVGAHYPNEHIEKLVIYAFGDLQADGEPVSPCGGCRQVISETIMRQGIGFELILVGKNGKVVRFANALDLLPFPFGFSS